MPTPGPTEKPGLAAALQGHKHVDDLDAGFKHFGGRGPAGQRGWVLMNGAPLDPLRRGLPVDGVAEDVEHAREDRRADGRLERAAGIGHWHAARQALSGRERDPADTLGVELGGHLDGDAALRPGPEQGRDRRQPVLKARIDHAAADRNDRADVRGFACRVHVPDVTRSINPHQVRE